MAWWCGCWDTHSMLSWWEISRRPKSTSLFLVCAIEQATMDGGSWDIAFLLSLFEDPPLQVFQDRMTLTHSQGRPFTPLAPSPWCAVVLAYLKELEILSTKKTETKAKAKAKQDPTDPAEDAPSSPRRKPRFPKKVAKDPKSSGQWRVSFCTTIVPALPKWDVRRPSRI